MLCTWPEAAGSSLSGSHVEGFMLLDLASSGSSLHRAAQVRDSVWNTRVHDDMMLEALGFLQVATRR